jgi:hypothetical protein
MRRDPAIVDLNHLVQTPHSATLLLLVHLASIPGVSTPPLVLSARVPQFKCAKESVRYPQEMQRALCNFANMWGAKTLPLRQKVSEDQARGVNEKVALTRYEAARSNLDREMRNTYSQTYQDKALVLRGKLIAAIHDTGKYADYSLEENGLSKQYGLPGNFAFSLLDMDSVCHNFTDLVEGYRKSLR